MTSTALRLLIGISLLQGACHHDSEPAERAHRVTHEGLQATLWMQTSAEYRVAAAQTYRLASSQLDGLVGDRSTTAVLEQEGDFSVLPPALIVDVDETVLDNSPFQARLVQDRTVYSTELWSEWVGEARAEPIPGALEFLKGAAAAGIKVFYVTNRNAKGEAATIRNLVELGFPEPDPDSVMTRGEQPDWGSDKSTRRRFVASQYRVVMLFGDDLNDFVSGARTGSPADRRELASQHQSRWGVSWFLLPNPAYGSWDGATYGFEYDLPDEEQLKMKFRSLKTLR